MRILTTAFLVLTAGLAVAPVAASELTDPIKYYFSERQRALITDYARSNGAVVDEAKQEAPQADGGKGKPKQKQKALPPGIAKNLARGKPLPPGIAKTRLPPTLMKQLPPAPKGHEIVVVDGRVVLVDIATQVVRDKIENVILR